MIPKWLRQWRQQAYSVKKHWNQHPERRFQLWLEELETRTLPSFALGAIVNAGAVAYDVAVADFNGDGAPDLAVTTSYSNVKVFFGNGDGTFKAPQTLTAGNFTYGLAFADVDGDGTPDLIVSNFRSNTISIFLASRNSTFSAALNFSVGSGPEGIAVGDFNGDGKPDIAVADRGGGTVSVLLHTSSNGVFFAPAVNYTVDGSPKKVIAADLNNDGKLDLVSVNISSNTVSVLLGTGSGTFGSAQNFSVGASPISVAAGDLNGDGRLDLAVADSGANANIVSELLGNGDGTFQAAQNVPAGLNPDAVAIADVNGNGFLSLIVSNPNQSGVSVIFGNGNGTFLAPKFYGVGGTFQYPTNLVLADLNGDGLPDILAVNPGAKTVSVFMNTCAPPFLPLQSFTVLSNPLALATGDLNGDRIPDLQVADPSNTVVSVLLGNGDGTFSDPLNLPVTDPFDVAAADLNRDGKVDLVVASPSSNNVSVLLGNGNGTFQGAQNYPDAILPDAVKVIDVNGDGIPDLVVAGYSGVSVLLGKGDGTFQAARIVATVSIPPRDLGVADIDGNLAPDIIAIGPNAVVAFLGNGDGTFKPMQTLYYDRRGLESLAVADFNGDGRPDLATGIYSYDYPGKVLVLLANGNGTFKPVQTLPVGVEVSAVAAADVNGDGHIDLISANRVASTISVLQGNGDGTFQAAQNIAGGVTPRAVAVADFNVDGRPDIAVINDFSESIGILLRNATSQFQIGTRTLAVAGNSIPVTVTALDAQSRVDCRFTGTVTLSSSDPQFTGPGPYTFTPQDQGKHTFFVTLKSAGFQRVTVTDGKNSASSNTVLVQPAAASKLVFPQQPLASIVGTPIPPLLVQLLDPFNNLSTSSASVSLMIASGPAGGTFTTSSATTVAALNGIATFSNVAFTAAGTYTLTASSAGLTGATSTSFQISVATTRTWSGRGPDNQWSDAANWLENVAPTAGNDLFFPDGALRIATGTNNFASGFTIHSINFTAVAGGYDLLGNGIALTAGITGNTGIDKVDLVSIVLGASQTFQAANSTLAVSSAITLHGFTLTLDGSLAPTGNDALTGIVSGAGSTLGAIIKNGAGEWLVTGSNTFSGPVTINNGTLAVNNSNSLGAATNSVTVNPGSTGTGSLQVFNNISVLQALTINGNGNNLSPGALDIRDTTGNDTFGAISLNSAASILSANIGVNTMTLTGAIQNNGFDLSIVGAGGYTTILSSTATVSGTGHVLNFGSIFSGTGTLTSALNINQGTLSPGTSGTPGTLNTSDVNFGIGTNFNPILGNTAASLLSSTGSVNLAGSNLSLSLQNGFTASPGQSYVIITAAGSINGTFNGLPDGSLVTIGSQQFFIHYVNGGSVVGGVGTAAANGRIVLTNPPVATVTTLAANPNPVIPGQPVTLTATVSSPVIGVAVGVGVGGVSPASVLGFVTFLDNGVALAQPVPLVNGAAVLATTLSAGSHSIVAAFSGTTTFQASTSNPPINSFMVGWHDTLMGDFTGDGKTDIASRTAGGDWWVAVSTGSGFTNQMWGHWNEAAGWKDVQVGDFNGDGKMDIAGRTAGGQWWIAQSTGSSFVSSLWTTWAADSPSVTWVDVHVADFNGDKKADITGRLLQAGQWWTSLSTGSTFTTSLWATWATVPWVDVKVGDLNGDKKADIVGRYGAAGQWWAAISTGSSFMTSLWATWAADSPSVTWVDVQVGDFSGDGKADITARLLQAGQWWTGISTGSSFNTSLWATWSPNVTWVDVKVGDFNHDGKADIVGRYLQGGVWYAGTSTGSSFMTTLWDTWSPAMTWVDVGVGDFNGDGVPDLAGRLQQTGQWWTALSDGSSSFSNHLWTTWAL